MMRIRISVLCVLALGLIPMSNLCVDAKMRGDSGGVQINEAVVSKFAATRWRSDLSILRTQLHASGTLFAHSLPTGKLDRSIARLAALVPELSANDIIVEISRIVALAGDGHDGSDLMGFHSYPVQVYPYADGIFVQAAPANLKSIVGCRILSVDRIPVKDVVRELRPIISASNEMSFLWNLPYYIMRPEVLHGIGLRADLMQMPLSVQCAGRAPMTLRLIPQQHTDIYFAALGAKPGSRWKDARDGTQPVWLQNQYRTFWYKYYPLSQTMYVQDNRVLNDNKQKFADFFRQVLAYTSAHMVRKFVLDLRLNGGGDNTLLAPVVGAISQNKQINRRGNFYVLVGRQTQSAAQNFVNRLQLRTHATFVGEPTGERPNHFGDPRTFTLPWSRISVSVATRFWQDMPVSDQRKATMPAINAQLTSWEYRAGIDPAFEALGLQGLEQSKP